MSSVVSSARPQYPITRMLLLILIGAGSMALSLWWFAEPPATEAATLRAQAPQVSTQVVSALSSVDALPSLGTRSGAAARTVQMRKKPGVEVVDPTPEPAVKKAPAKKKTKKKQIEPKPVNCKKAKCIALTFDDGPGKHTAKLLKTLHKEKAPATFFVIGRHIEAYPGVLRTMSEQGHEVASHTWSHDDLRQLSTKKINKELKTTAKAIKKETRAAPKLVRPPYGAVDAHVQKALEKRGESAIMWNVDTLDWKNKSVKLTAETAMGAESGSIILMHDVQETTVDAAPRIIKKLRKQGYTFVTVSDLLGDVKPGEIYRRR